MSHHLKTVRLECGHLADVVNECVVGGLAYCDKCPTTDNGNKAIRHIAACPPHSPPSAVEYEEVLADKRRLVRELDVLINGENAAPQASLCDIVGQIATMLKSGELRRGKNTETVDDQLRISNYQAVLSDIGTWMVVAGGGCTVADEIATDAMLGMEIDPSCHLRGKVVLYIQDRVNGTLDYVAKSASISVVESKASDESTAISNIWALLKKWSDDDREYDKTLGFVVTAIRELDKIGSSCDGSHEVVCEMSAVLRDRAARRKELVHCLLKEIQ